MDQTFKSLIDAFRKVMKSTVKIFHRIARVHIDVCGLKSYNLTVKDDIIFIRIRGLGQMLPC